MILPDVNVLVYAHRGELPGHAALHEWLSRLVNGEQTYAVSDFVVNGFVRLVTSREVFRTPTPTEQALAFAAQVRNQPQAVLVGPGPRHWEVFGRLCQDAGVRGSLVPDAFLAALAIEHGCELATMDRGFARFPGLRLHEPTKPAHERMVTTMAPD